MMTIDRIESKLQKTPLVNHKMKTPENICKIFFYKKTKLVSFYKNFPYNFAKTSVV